MNVLIDRYQRDLDEEILAVIEGRSLPLYDMMRYHFGWTASLEQMPPGARGKRLRPMLCLLASETVGGDYRLALPAAASLELVHNFSLIHDDIQDGSPERRHRPTIWKLWGQAQGINVGDAMFALARLALLRLRMRDVPAEKVLRCAVILDEMCLRLCEGQYVDLRSEESAELDIDGYLAMAENKTGSLMAASLEMGALLGTDDEKVVEAFREAGLSLGVAFQIRDDILDLWGDQSVTGKPACDLKLRKGSLPLLLALDAANSHQRDEMARALWHGGQKQVLRLIDENAGRERAQEMARERTHSALAGLDSVCPATPSLVELRRLIVALVERES